VLPVAQTFFADPFVQASFKLDSVVCVCDASNFELLEGGNSEMEGTAGSDVANLLREQLALSDVCLLNKCDLINSSQRDGVAARLRKVNPGIQVVPCRHGKVNLGQVLKVNSFSLDGAMSLDAHFLSSESEGHGHGHEDGHGHGHEESSGTSHAHAAMSSLGLEMPDAVTREPLEAWLRSVVERLGNDLIRLKGVLRCRGDQVKELRLVVQGVGGHIDITEASDDSPAASVSNSRLVIIGRVSDWTMRMELKEGFLALAAGSAKM